MSRTWTYDPGMSIDAVMRRWPAAIRVVMRHRMLCVGCPVGPFHSIAEACAEHGLDECRFAAELAAAVNDRGEADGPVLIPDPAAGSRRSATARAGR